MTKNIAIDYVHIPLETLEFSGYKSHLIVNGLISVIDMKYPPMIDLQKQMYLQNHISIIFSYDMDSVEERTCQIYITKDRFSIPGNITQYLGHIEINDELFFVTADTIEDGRV